MEPLASQWCYMESEPLYIKFLAQCLARINVNKGELLLVPGTCQVQRTLGAQRKRWFCVEDQGSIKEGQAGTQGEQGAKSIPGQGEEHEQEEAWWAVEYVWVLKNDERRWGWEVGYLKCNQCIIPYYPEKVPLSPSPYLVTPLLLLILPI